MDNYYPIHNYTNPNPILNYKNLTYWVPRSSILEKWKQTPGSPWRLLAINKQGFCALMKKPFIFIFKII